jgi:hypothetical protein
MNPDIVFIFSTASYFDTAKTNKQCMADTFSSLGVPVVYIEPTGLRLPRIFSFRELCSIYAKLRNLHQTTLSGRQNILVVRPFCLPSVGFMASRPFIMVNSLILFVQLKLRVATFLSSHAFSVDKKLLILTLSYHPFFAVKQILNKLFTSGHQVHHVYHAVDDIDALPWRKHSKTTISSLLGPKLFDICICTNPLTARRLWTSLSNKDRCLPIYIEPNRIFSALPKPLVGFPTVKKKNKFCYVATFTNLKVDYALLFQCFSVQPSASLELVGRHDSSCSDPLSFHKLTCLPNVTWHGERSYTQAIDIMRCCQFGLIANSINAYTECSTPMKFLDYITAGCIPVARHMPYLELYADVQSFTYRTSFDLICLVSYLNSLSDSVLSGIATSNLANLGRYTYIRRIIDMLHILRAEDTVESRPGSTIIPLQLW